MWIGLCYTAEQPAGLLIGQDIGEALLVGRRNLFLTNSGQSGSRAGDRAIECRITTPSTVRRWPPRSLIDTSAPPSSLNSSGDRRSGLPTGEPT